METVFRMHITFQLRRKEKFGSQTARLLPVMKKIILIVTFVELALPKCPLIGLEIMSVIAVPSESFPRIIEIIIIPSVIFNWIIILLRSNNFFRKSAVDDIRYLMRRMQICLYICNYHMKSSIKIFLLLFGYAFVSFSCTFL